MAMLLNPKTHLRNLGGNALMVGLDKASNKISAALQKFLPKERRTQALFIDKDTAGAARTYYDAHESELLSQTSKYDEGIGLNQYDKRVFRQGLTGTKAGQAVTGKLAEGPGIVGKTGKTLGKEGLLEATRRGNYALLQAEDKLFFKRAYIDRLSSAMKARGIKNVADVPADLMNYIKTEAEKAVFRDQSKLATAISGLKRSKSGFLVDTVMPFTKTPINITRRGLDFSPVGIGKGIKKLFSKETVAEGIDDLAKGMAGTGMMALGYYLADAGILTGRAPDNKNLAGYEKLTGDAPFSIVPLGITYDWAQPFAIPISAGVAIHDALSDDPRSLAKLNKAIEAGDTETVKSISGFYGQAMLDAFNAGGDTIFNMSVLQGIQQLIGDPQGFISGVMQLPSSYTKQFIPTLSGQAAATIDPTVYQTKFGPNNPLTLEYWKSQGAQVAAKIPGLAPAIGLQPQVNAFGQNVQGVQNPWLRALQSFVNPGNINVAQDIDPQIDGEIRRLYQAGQIQQFPITPTRSFSFMGKAVSITDAEYTEYQRTTGQESLSAMKDIINSSDYKKIPASTLSTQLKALAAQRGVSTESLRGNPDVQARLLAQYQAGLLNDAIIYARSLAQLNILRKRGLLNPEITFKQLAARLGISQELAKELLK